MEEGSGPQGLQVLMGQIRESACGGQGHQARAGTQAGCGWTGRVTVYRQLQT